MEKQGQTRDVSFRGLYFLIEASVETGSSIEFVLTLPQQITLAGDVHIRCYARVLRVEPHNGRAAWRHASSATNSFPQRPKPLFHQRGRLTTSAEFPSLIFPAEARFQLEDSAWHATLCSSMRTTRCGRTTCSSKN